MTQTTVAAKGRFARFVHSAGGKIKNSLAVVGVAALGAAYYEYQTLSPAWEKEESSSSWWTTKEDPTAEPKKSKKKVLVIPFNRLRLVEQKKRDFSTALQNIDRKDSETKIEEMELKELVDLIHHAAGDPDISALYGIFGHGSVLMSSGWADLEEVRNALRVFRESHRRHAEPNLGHEELLIPRVDSKPMYAYTDTFASFGDPGNKDYYLASVFTHIHMQRTGELNLFGLTSQQVFLRGLLEKYGINAHVFKHGKYKNAPNALTEWGFNKPHKENVTNILEDTNADICEDIQATRSKALLTNWLRGGGDIWQNIQNAGTFPAHTAFKSGLVDYIPRRSPLFDLMEANLKDGAKEEYKAKWESQETDFDRFSALAKIELKEYAKKLAKKKKAEDRMKSWHDLAEKRPEIRSVLSALGVVPADSNVKPKETVAVLHIKGGIADGTASTTLKALEKIRKDKNTKCLVVRVTSPGGTIQACETISQELKAMKIPVVFSFGNVSASGGYYIASSADRIFASKKTVTGSIGVFGIRPDFTDFVARYGITVEHVSASEFSNSLSPFHPMTRKMKENFAQSIDRYYKQFKGVVADGRGLTLENVEDLGQGRVWTGTQAKANGLVDEIGGLYRALAYAKREYTSGDATVVVYPKKQSMLERLVEASGTNDLSAAAKVLYEWLATPVSQKEPADCDTTELLAKHLLRAIQSPSTAGNLMGGVFLAVDENAAFNLLLQNSGFERTLLPNDNFWR